MKFISTVVLFLAVGMNNAYATCQGVLQYAQDNFTSSSSNFSKYAIYSDIAKSTLDEINQEWGGSGLFSFDDTTIDLGANNNDYSKFQEKIRDIFSQLNINSSENFESRIVANTNVLDAWVSCLNIANQGGLKTAFTPSGGIEITWRVPTGVDPNNPNNLSIDINSVTVQNTLRLVGNTPTVLNVGNPKIIHVERIGDEGGWVKFDTSRGDVEVQILPILPDICEVYPGLASCWESGVADSNKVYGQKVADLTVPNLSEAFKRTVQLGGDSFIFVNHSSGPKDLAVYRNGTVGPPCDGCTAGITYAFQLRQ